MNFSLFFIRPTYSKISSSPTKLAEILALGVPVVTNAGVGDVDEIILNNNLGIVIKDFNVSSYDVAIENILQHSFDEAAIMAIARNKFDISVALKKYGAVYREILN